MDCIIEPNCTSSFSACLSYNSCVVSIDNAVYEKYALAFELEDFVGHYNIYSQNGTFVRFKFA
jgi:hypothetical protein